MGARYLFLAFSLALMFVAVKSAQTYCDLFKSECFTTCPTGYTFILNTGIANINCDVCCKAPTPVDECTEGSHNCDVNAACTDTASSFKCKCNTGYDGSGVTCTDINECTLDTHPCHADANCTNEPGSYSCQCKTGYAGNGYASCVADVDECKNENNNCVPEDDGGLCTNTVGSFVCSCAPGYTDDGNNGCADVIECDDTALNKCDTNADCTNTIGSYKCACKPGFLGDGFSCVADVDECDDNTLNNCLEEGDGGMCNNTLNSFNCSCLPGYTGDGINSCTDVVECDQNAKICGDALCENTVGSYKCNCDAGYEHNSVTNKCEDIDECKTANPSCGTHASCNNTVGSYTCVCDVNYMNDDDGTCIIKQCGIPGPDSRIMMGATAAECRWGWAASLRVNFKGDAPTYDNTRHLCSGVIIDPNWVLTSAACIKKFPSTVTFMLTSGTVNVTTGGDANANMQQRFVKTIATHHDFNNGDITQIDDSTKGFDATYLYDGNQFTLLKVDEPFIFDECTQAICLPEPSSGCSSKTDCYIAGWGSDIHQASDAPLLQEDRVAVLSKATCDVIRAGQERHMPSANAEICAVDNSYNILNGELPSRPCYGDAGSGFYCKGADGYYHLNGIALMEATGFCFNPFLPYKVGDVSEVVDWIKERIST